MKRLLLMGAIFAMTCAMGHRAKANVAMNKCAFKIDITNATGQTITVRKLYYKVTNWERVGGANNPIKLKNGNTKRKSVLNIAVSCQKQHLWTFQYKCSESYKKGSVTYKPGARTLRHKLKGKNNTGWVLAKVKVEDCEGKATWSKKEP